MDAALGLLAIIIAWASFPLVAGLLEGYYRCDLPLENHSMDQYRAAGKDVSCPHCEGRQFDERQILQNSFLTTFLGFDWANRRATALTCKGCGCIVWFSQKPQVDGNG